MLLVLNFVFDTVNGIPFQLVSSLLIWPHQFLSSSFPSAQHVPGSPCCSHVSPPWIQPFVYRALIPFSGEWYLEITWMLGMFVTIGMSLLLDPFQCTEVKIYILFKNHKFILPCLPSYLCSPMVRTLVLPCIHFSVKH